MNRENKCDCWCNLQYCPVNCEEKRSDILDLETPEGCKSLFVQGYKEL